MIYFIKGQVPTDKDCEALEAALRRVAIRRHIPLDWHSSAAVSFDRKYFLGYENRDSLQLMRIRRYFQRLMPKLIVRFEKGSDFRTYRMRYSMLSTIVLLFLITVVALNINYVKAGESPDDLYAVSTYLLLFIVFSFLECFIVKMKIAKAISCS